MENKQIARSIKLLAQLMDLHEQNPFKVKALTNAAFRLDKLSQKLSSLSLAELETIEGVGKSVAAKIAELNERGSIAELDQLISETPPGVLEMLMIKGLGPKKVQIIWNQLGIESLGELYYACNENRLVEAKGFGYKTQEDIKKLIEFTMSNTGKFLYASVMPWAEAFLARLQKQFPNDRFDFTGEYRRRCEIIHELDILAVSENQDAIISFIREQKEFSQVEVSEHELKAHTEAGIRLAVCFCTGQQAASQLFIRTGSDAHFNTLGIDVQAIALASYPDERAIYESLRLPYFEPELREGLVEASLLKLPEMPTLIRLEDLVGTLHNHSTWSDGIHTLEEMAVYCRDELKLQYLGICDHSRTAVYANGLSAERVLQQHRQIDELNKSLAPFHIFKGIESDILNDGSLDYEEDILKLFDFVVASVHSNLKMNEEKANARLLKAIENQYTTILGHPTGRLLLAREGYPINHHKIIDACAANGVAIEINANPLRLDIDWRYVPYALEKGVKLCINPDAHRKEGFHDMYFGTLVARKGALTPDMCLNAMSRDELKAYFNQRKNR
jgi:DNA polymerase (family 10)